MEQIPSVHRTDDQLEAILAETGNWVVNGQRGQVLCMAASLRRAIERAHGYAKTDAVVTSIARLPPDNVVVLPTQIERLRKMIAGREVVPIVS